MTPEMTTYWIYFSDWLYKDASFIIDEAKIELQCFEISAYPLVKIICIFSVHVSFEVHDIVCSILTEGGFITW